MDISAVGSVAFVPRQLQDVRARDQDTAAGNAADTAAAAITGGDDDADDSAAVATALTRSSPAVQEALVSLQTSQ